MNETIQYLNPKGSLNPDYYIIGHTSSELEVTNNNPFDPNSSKANSYLSGVLNSLGINELNCRFNKMLNVVSDNNRSIDQSIKDACIESLKEDLCLTVPKIVILLGTEVGSLFLEDRCKYISRTRGRLFDVEVNGVLFKMIVTYSPSFITKEYANNDEESNQDMTDYANQFYNDINYACRYISGDLVDISSKVLKYAKTYDEFKEYFDENLKDCEFPSYDIESNAKDPRCADFRIVGYSLAPNESTGIYVIRRTLEYDMPIEDWNKCVELTKDYLMSRKCLVHNIMYEKPATLNEWNINITNFEDSLIKARLLLGGKTGAGLKDQCILNLGYPEWDADLGDYMYNFDILRYKLAHTPAGNHRWDYDVLVEKGFQGLLDTYNECIRISKELSNKSELSKEEQKQLESNTLDKRSLECVDAMNNLIALIYNYYTSDEVSNILDLIGKEVVNMIDINYEGILPYSSIPMKIITKYGAMDSVATHDLDKFLSKRLDNESTDTVKLWNGYRVMKEHFIVGSHLEMNGLFWNEEVAKSNWDWLATTAKDSLRKCILSGFLDDQIYENSMYLLQEHVQNNMMDYVKEVLGDFEMQAKGIKIISTGKRISYKNLIWELPESFRESMKPWVIEESKKRIMDDKLHPNYSDLKYIFNPASNKNTPILNKILVTKEIQIGYLIVKIRDLLESESFSIDTVPMPDKLLFKTIQDIDKYNKSEECTQKITSRQLFLKIDAVLNQIAIQSRLVMDIIRDAVSYKLDGTSEPVMLKLFDYYEAIGIDIEDESTYTPEFEFFFNFRMYKKCTKLISSYIDGSKIGRGSVWIVDKKDIDENKLEPIRTKRYDWNKEKRDDEEYLMQPSWGVCFGKDTKILMADGTEKFIQDIKVGDEVLCVDENIIYDENAYDNEWFYNEDRIHSTKVTKLFTRESETVCVRWRNYDPDFDDEGFHVTLNHPFLSTDRTWRTLEDIISSNDSSVGFVMYHPDWTVDSLFNDELKLGNHQVEQVYNLETESHTYIAERLIVHNCTAETERWRSGIHTLPMGRVVKGMYTSRYKGGVIAAPDYSQLEIRITAGLSKCKGLLDAYRNGEDVHLKTAMSIFNKPADQITKVERRFCLRGSTKIKLLNGTTRTIKELADESVSDFWVYSWDTTNNMMVPGLAKYSKKTIRTNKIFKVTFDNGKYIECTDNHRFLMLDNSYKEARDLQLNDRVKPLYFEVTDYKDDRIKSENRNQVNYLSDGYEIFVDTDGNWYPTHRRVTDILYPDVHFKGMTRHHKDFNKRNNTPDNLLLLSWSDHMKLHCELGDHNFSVLNPELWDYDNPKYEESRRRHAEGVSKSLKEKHQTDEEYHQQELEILNNARKIRWDREGESERFGEYYSEHMKERWKNPDYQEYQSKQTKKLFNNSKLNKCLELCDNCIKKYGFINEEVYTSERSLSNYKYSTFTYNTLLEKVGSQELLENYLESGFRYPTHGLEEYKNHRVVKIEIISIEDEDMYDIEVDKYDNFLVDLEDGSGVFVHNSKMGSFRILYGSTPEGFASQFLDGDVQMARKIFDGFYNAYPEVKEWMDKRHAEVEKYGKVSCENVGYFINIDVANDPEGIEGAYRKAGNYPIQSQGSMVAGYVLASINNYFMKNNLYTKPISFIHDSLEFDIHPKELFNVTPVILHMMNDIPIKEFDILTKADVVLGTSMGMENEVKEMKFSDDGNEGWLTLEGFDDDLDDMYNHWKTESNYRVVECEDIGDPEEVYIRKRELFQEKLALGPFLGKTRRLIQRKFHIIMN